MATTVTFPNFDEPRPWHPARGFVLGLAMSAILWVLIGVAVFVAMT